MRTRWAVCCFLFFGMAPPMPAQSHRPGAEQLHFTAEDNRAKKPVALPQDVLELLKKDEQVKSAIEGQEGSAQKIPRSWYSASAVHLSTSGRPDYVVVGNPPLTGANVTTFWVFRASTRGYEAVLVAPAHDLIVKRTRTNVFRDI